MLTNCIRLLVASCCIASLAFAQQAQHKTPTNAPTAKQIIADMQTHTGLRWSSDTVDTFKAGDPDTPVTGIAVTMMATMDVLQRAAARGLNLVITHEPTFYAHRDTPDGMSESDPVWADKRAFIAAHHMVVFRFHDYWHEREPDGIRVGVVRALGWERFQTPGNPQLFTIPATTLQQLAGQVAQRLESPVVRFVGNPGMKVTKVALSPGAAGFKEESHLLDRDDVEVLLVGETHEWETVEYAADATTQGRRKALVVIGHIPSEQPGMEECTRWLKTFVNNVRIEFIPAKQPFSVVK